jgi:hypothetical protein
LAVAGSEDPSGERELAAVLIRVTASTVGPQGTPPLTPAGATGVGGDEATARDDKFRDLLQQYAADAQDAYDKAVLTLSGGALGVSFAFIKDVVGTGPLHHWEWLVAAWSAWVLSTASKLWSFYSSEAAMQAAIDKWDDGEREWKGLLTAPNLWTTILDKVAGVSFVLGVIAMGVFVVVTLRS